LGRPREQGAEQGLLVVAQQPRPPLSVFVCQGFGLLRAGVGIDPVVDALPRHAEQVGDVRNRPPSGELQDGQGTAVEAGIAGFRQLTLQAAPLPTR